MNGLAQPDYALLDAEQYKHQARLLLALHSARPVELDGKTRFIHTVTASQEGGRIEMTVYLAGDPTPIDSSKIAPKEARA